MRYAVLAFVTLALVGCASAERFAVRVTKCIAREVPELVEEGMTEALGAPAPPSAVLTLTPDEIAALRAAGMLVEGGD